MDKEALIKEVEDHLRIYEEYLKSLKKQNTQKDKTLMNYNDKI